MIVKVQLPLMTDEEVPQALIYNEDRSVQFQVPVTDHILKGMDGRFKRYFEAARDEQYVNIMFHRPVEDQDW
jgi:hypothetical protein